ncbi:MAG TPA: ABC transporter permease [Candidatus Competibacteraceae bacterium]|nr:ABC transporter permease [Candidatus Competibacteraceae bacterium]HRZ07679.1 ABC transporter permease [Candidatus Competibacteraceae bacterium]HSA46420.1 ABC transporter permease [Candidatus Competibacteraceae bacterium]
MSRLGRALVTMGGLLLIWQAVVTLGELPPYLLPDPWAVVTRLWRDAGLLLSHAGVTALEIVLGMLLGTLLGSISALALSYSQWVRHWLLPILIASQAIPVFAIAPLLVLWLGYGLASKIAMATLIIYFPVTANFYDGLRHTPHGWLDLARVMAPADRRWAVLRYIVMPAALPALGSGLRVAAAVAPIGAVLGEWVGSSAGLGYLMLHANSRMQIDLLFAALLTLATLAVGLYFTVDAGLKWLLPWHSPNPEDLDID